VTLVLRNAVYWDGEATSPTKADITCAGGRVVSIDPQGRAARPPHDGLEFDLGGAFLLPGLIDAHVHLVWAGGSDPAARVASEGEQLTVVRAAANAQAQLQAGVTTVRDLGSYWDIAISIARAVDRGAIQGPTVIASGRTVIMTGGHDPFWGIPSDGVDAVTRAVRGQVDRGAGVIKTAATGGVYGRPEGEDVHDSELSYEELRALTAEAHRRGRRVAAHALGTEGIDNAVRAGVDTIEHGVFLTERIVEQMVASGTVLCPTLEVYRRIAEGASGSESPPYAAAKAVEVVEAHRDSVRMALELGVSIIAGTDAGSVNMPHPTLVDELEALVSTGVSTHDALLAATSRAADALDRPARGRISVGAVADFVMVDHDPFEDVGALRRVWGVVRDQRMVKGRSVGATGTPRCGSADTEAASV
jgi:imidazolonepropionase-like amidohydrolase